MAEEKRRHPDWHQYVLTDGYSAGLPNLKDALESMVYEMTAQRQQTGILSDQDGNVVATLMINFRDKP